ncbi:MAG: restriction endonuclease, partial [Lachnospiraceae bacterium]|nr:restriction endonuclease [Lachnospiraceae bacterium]
MPAALFFVLYLLTGADDRYRYLPLWRRILRVVQCKRYETRLGSTPVQEIVAARSFYEADRACVMSLLLLTVIVFCAAAAVFAVLRQIPALAPVFAPEDVLHRLFGAVFGGAA